MVRWGLIPSWNKELKPSAPLINARSETIAEKPAFRHAIRCRRCLIPASGFFEWRRESTAKVPEYIRLKDGSPMVFAGNLGELEIPGRCNGGIVRNPHHGLKLIDSTTQRPPACHPAPWRVFPVARPAQHRLGGAEGPVPTISC